MSQTNDDWKRDPYEVVARFARDDQRMEAYHAMRAFGPEALPAVREGLRHGHWQVRRWCAIWMDHHALPEALPDLIPLLRDPKAKVRMFAVHSLACDRCKADENPVDVVPLLIERIREDESIRVVKMAVIMLGMHARPELEPIFREVLDLETNEKLRLHAAIGVLRCREAARAESAGTS